MTAWNSAAVGPLAVVRGSASGDPARDLAAGVDLLQAVRSGEAGPTLRLYRPAPTLAFGQRDTRLEGYDDAARIAADAGFAPLVRKAGGRAAAYHRGTLIVDHVEPDHEAMLGHQGRFRALGELYAGALGRLGVDARVGEIPGEYCPGEFSVHGVPGAGASARHPVKLVGTAQRIVAGAWLFASVFVVEDSAPLRAVLTDVYDALDLPFDPGTAGAVNDLVPGATVAGVEDALLTAYAEHVELAGH
ncbi:lipoate--protein ligase family protein [Zhihengliuella halotolerans]|uniref:lipoate--protein ligase family protein n=1 Tax=Zhihengliuella halotolerans TaxID=370736 RepID=UPI000C80268F|nr:lipoate--protein ligase [Zhihengliuella halotolerans]